MKTVVRSTVSFFLVCLSTTVLLWNSPSSSQSEKVRGEIASDTTWDSSMNPIIVEADVIVPVGVELTLLEGTQVFFRENAGIVASGTLSLQGQPGQTVSLGPETEGDEWGRVSLSGPVAVLSMHHTRAQGGCVEVTEGAVCLIEDSSFEDVASRVCVDIRRAGKIEIRRTGFNDVHQAIRSVRTQVTIEDCAFMEVVEDAVTVDYPNDEVLPPESLRMTIPKRMVSGKTTTFRVDVLDRKGDLYWWMWEEKGTVSAVSVESGSEVVLSATEFDVVHGIGSLTTSLDSPGDVDLTVSIAGLSASKRIAVLGESAPVVTLPPVLTDDLLDWGPEHGIIHLATKTIVPETRTLRIRPGTLVMMDGLIFGTREGEPLEIFGGLDAQGTQEDPIYFFPTDMFAPWRQVRYRNRYEPAVLDSVIFAGGASGPKETAEEHTFDGPALRFRGTNENGERAVAGASISNCVFVDLVGKGIFSHGGSEYTLSNCLFSRCEIGCELHSDEVVMEDCYFLKINSGANDQDALYLWPPKVKHQLRRCIFAFGGDDGIDTWDSDIEISDCLVYGMEDKNITLYRHSADITNCLVFDSVFGFQLRETQRDEVRMTNCTLVGHATGARIINARGQLEKVILWDNPTSVATNLVPPRVTLNYCDLSPPPQTLSGTGNLDSDPMFRDPQGNDYRLAYGSPAASAGPEKEQIGWLGYPSSETAPPGPASHLRGCLFQSVGSRGVAFSRNADGIVENCQFSSVSGKGVAASGKSEVWINRCVVDRCATGVALTGEARGSFDSCTVVGCDQAAVDLVAEDPSTGGGWLEIDNSILWNNTVPVLLDESSTLAITYSNVGPGTGAVVAGEGNINADPLFYDEPGGDYRLNDLSPSAGTGRDGGDMGAFPLVRRKFFSGWWLR